MLEHSPFSTPAALANCMLHRRNEPSIKAVNRIKKMQFHILHKANKLLPVKFASGKIKFPTET